MLNIGFIGCGGIAHHHASRLIHIRGARIIAAADVVADTARGFARDYGAQHHADDYTPTTTAISSIAPNSTRSGSAHPPTSTRPQSLRQPGPANTSSAKSPWR